MLSAKRTDNPGVGLALILNPGRGRPWVIEVRARGRVVRADGRRSP